MSKRGVGGRNTRPSPRTSFATLTRALRPTVWGQELGTPRTCPPVGVGAASRRLLNHRPAPEGPALPLGRNPGETRAAGLTPPARKPLHVPHLLPHPTCLPTQPNLAVETGGREPRPLGGAAGARREVKGKT